MDTTNKVIDATQQILAYALPKEIEHFLSIAELLSHKQYDKVFEKLNKLENVRVIRYNN